MTKRIDDLLKEEDENKLYVSFEFYPPRTAKGEESFMPTLIPSFTKADPIFLDLTWGAGGKTSEMTMRLSKEMQDAYPNIPINMHITCTNMPQGLIKEALDFAKNNNIRNIVALRGDPPEGQEFRANPDGFHCALDLVRYIRATYGDYFCISVAGYPEGHPDQIGADGRISAEAYAKEMDYLKAKVDAGADIIITQLFFDPQLFFDFEKKCRDIGIRVPILAGIMPLTTYNGLQRMITLSKTYIPPEMLAKVEELKDKPEELKEYGVELGVSMIQKMREAGIGYKHIHLYTLNSTHQSFKIIKAFGLRTE